MISIYFIFTSLTTIGFGDYHPRSSLERAFISIMMLCGVGSFSYILGVFVVIIHEAFQLTEEIGLSEELSHFIMVIKRFNGDKHIDKDFEERMI